MMGAFSEDGDSKCVLQLHWIIIELPLFACLAAKVPLAHGIVHGFRNHRLVLVNNFKERPLVLWLSSDRVLFFLALGLEREVGLVGDFSQCL
jgi:hypothetical protein